MKISVAVIDTNLVASAFFLTPSHLQNGTWPIARQLIEAFYDGQFLWVWSEDILAEYDRIVLKMMIELLEDATLDEQDVKEATVVYLYNTGKISEKQACKLIGKTRVEFDEILTVKFGIPRLNTKDDIDIESKAFKHYQQSA